MTQVERDAELIQRLGGPSKVAELIGIDKRGGAQRIQNWKVRGIPAEVKLKHMGIFMPELANPSTNTAEQGAVNV